MTKRLIIQMDEPHGFKPKTDSTLALALEAQARDYEVFYYTPNQLACINGEILANAKPIKFKNQLTDFYTSGDSQTINLETADVILIRQDPPYDMGYLSPLWLLERLKNPKILNNPTSIRNRPEKIFPLEFPEFIPPTCISADLEQLYKFQQDTGEVVVKPLYGFGGQSIFHIPKDGSNFKSLITLMLSQSNEPLIVQPFLPEVHTQEKRIMLINGNIAAAYNRIPQSGDIRANSAVGGSVAKTELTPKQIEISEAIGKICKAEGLMLIGLDVIGDHLIEINTTCPTGLRAAESLYNKNITADFWDAAEGKTSQ